MQFLLLFLPDKNFVKTIEFLHKHKTLTQVKTWLLAVPVLQHCQLPPSSSDESSQQEGGTIVTLRMMYYSVMTQANRQDLPITVLRMLNH